jgi:hypothetical protein
MLNCQLLGSFVAVPALGPRGAAVVVWGPAASTDAAALIAVGAIAKRLRSALVPGAKSILTPARLADREFRGGPRWRRLTADARQRGANQRAVNRTFLVAARFPFLVFAFEPGVSVGRRRSVCRQVGLFLQRRFINGRVCLGGVGLRFRVVRHAFGCGGGLREKRSWRLGLAPLARDPRVLVLVLGVAGRAAGLFDVGPDHGHDGMVGDAALSGAIVVQDVAKPKLPLLHQELPTDPHWQGKKLRKAFRS